jgi:hypothetical protein
LPGGRPQPNVRRLPVVEGGRLVGRVSLGDNAIERDPTSALADISCPDAEVQQHGHDEWRGVRG